MAHVGAVRQVVGAEARGPSAGRGTQPRWRCGRWCRTPPGPGSPGPELVGDEPERLVPADRLVVVARRPACSTGSVSRPCCPSQYSVWLAQLGDGVLGEEVRADHDQGRLPGRPPWRRSRRTRSALAVVGVRPRAARAVEAVLLVHRHDGLAGPVQPHLFDGRLHGVVHARDAGGPVFGPSPTTRSFSDGSSI